MTVYELIQCLAKQDSDADVYIKAKVKSYDFCCSSCCTDTDTDEYESLVDIENVDIPKCPMSDVFLICEVDR